MELNIDIIRIVAWGIPLVLAITLHEAAHAWVAWKLGDETAYRLGRVTFNPFRHIDPTGTILVPIALLTTPANFIIGWAKPVPVHFGRLGYPRRDMILVAAAGPGMNLMLAIISAIALSVPALTTTDFVVVMLNASIFVNVLLAILNMLPIPPLDGGRIVTGLLPAVLARPFVKLERYALFILVGLIFILPFFADQFGIRFNPFHWAVAGPINYVIIQLENVFGLPDVLGVLRIRI